MMGTRKETDAVFAAGKWDTWQRIVGSHRANCHEQEKGSERFNRSYGGRDRFGGGNGSRPTDRFGNNGGRHLKDIDCFNCHKKGHYSSNCPQNAMLCKWSEE